MREVITLRSIWKGAISFGLVTIPVSLFTATASSGISFNQLHAPCGARIRYVKRCSHCGQEVESQEIVRGYQYAEDQYVVISDEDLESLPLPTTREISIVDFVPIDEIDPAHYKTPYYVAPQEVGARAYSLLRDVLAETSRAGVCQVALRQKEHLSLLRPSGEVLVLHLMHYATEIRDYPPIPEPAQEPPEREKDLARTLVSSLGAGFDPTRYRDRYGEALQELIEAKIQGRDVVRAPEPEMEPVMDLARALEESLQAIEG